MVTKEEVIERNQNPSRAYIWKTPLFLPEGLPLSPEKLHEPVQTNFHLGFFAERRNGGNGIYIHEIHEDIEELGQRVAELRKKGDIADARNAIDPLHLWHIAYQYGSLDYVTDNAGFAPLDDSEEAMFRISIE